METTYTISGTDRDGITQWLVSGCVLYDVQNEILILLCEGRWASLTITIE